MPIPTSPCMMKRLPLASLEPTPSSISCVHSAILLESSPGLLTSNHPTSCRRIAERYVCRHKHDWRRPATLKHASPTQAPTKQMAPSTVILIAIVLKLSHISLPASIRPMVSMRSPNSIIMAGCDAPTVPAPRKPATIKNTSYAVA